MAFFSYVTCIHSLSFSILVALVVWFSSGSISNVQATTVALSPGPSTATRPLSENKSTTGRYKVTPEVTSRNEQPKSMQLRRFMWKEVDETMDDIIEGVANGAKLMKHMIDTALEDKGQISRFKKHADYRPAAASNLKFLLKNSPPKTTRLVKVTPTIPKKILKIIPTKPLILVEPTVKPVISTTLVENNQPSGHDEFKIDEKTLRAIEKKEEEKVEATISSVLPNIHHEEIIIGKYKSDWKPVIPDNGNTPSFSTKKPHIISHLHTNVFDVPYNKSQLHDETRYEVTENAAEETIQRPLTSRIDGDKISRAGKALLLTEISSNRDLYLKNHKNVDYSSTSESNPLITRQKTLAEQQALKKAKSKGPRSVNQSQVQSKSRLQPSTKDISTTSTTTTTTTTTTTRKPTQSQPTREKSKYFNSTTANTSSISATTSTSKNSSNRGSVKFGVKV